MKHYTFYRESNDFSDILNDGSLKKFIDTKIKWSNHLLIGLNYEVTDQILGYIVLKYGDDITQLTTNDYTPRPNVDYLPKR
jgi:hypothetical protein